MCIDMCVYRERESYSLVRKSSLHYSKDTIKIEKKIHI